MKNMEGKGRVQMSKQEQKKCPWETRELGCDEQYVAVASEAESAALDEALGMRSISIRMPASLIDAYKMIAAYHGVGYQPLMRDILQRTVPELAREVMEAQNVKAEEARERLEDIKSRKAA